MKVVLMDLDLSNRRHPFPNLALMKLSAYHKARGDEIFLGFPLVGADKIYASCVFSWNNKGWARLPRETIGGGTGIDLNTKLPAEIEHIMPDYSLYPEVNFSIGFTSRGCIRRCPWCIVPKKEGGIKANARIYEFWERSHNRIVLLDNNLLASPNWRQTMEDLVGEELLVDFNQGLDIRLINEGNIDYLKRLRVKQLRFAFDSMSYEKAARQGIELLLGNGFSPRKLSFYVLVGFEGDNTAIDRMKLLNSYGVDVYPMIYKGIDGKEPRLDKQFGETIFWHGAPQNLRKFLRITGRL